MHARRICAMEKQKEEGKAKIVKCFKEMLKSMAKTLDVGTENEYNMSYIDIDRVSIEGLI